MTRNMFLGIIKHDCVLKLNAWLEALRNYQLYKGAVGTTLCKNEAEQKCGSQCPFDILHLPRSVRRSRQLLLSIPDRSEIIQLPI